MLLVYHKSIEQLSHPPITFSGFAVATGRGDAFDFQNIVDELSAGETQHKPLVATFFGQFFLML